MSILLKIENILISTLGHLIYNKEKHDSDILAYCGGNIVFLLF